MRLERERARACHRVSACDTTIERSVSMRRERSNLYGRKACLHADRASCGGLNPGDTHGGLDGSYLSAVTDSQKKTCRANSRPLNCRSRGTCEIAGSGLWRADCGRRFNIVTPGSDTIPLCHRGSYSLQRKQRHSTTFKVVAARPVQFV